jgi:hypothetical protein
MKKMTGFVLLGVLLAGLIATPSFAGKTQAEADEIINAAYKDVLGRNPDPSGRNSYRDAIMNKDWSEERVRKDLKNSEEYKKRHADIIITKAYENVLGRKPDPSGLNTFRPKVNDDGWDQNKIERALKDSEEYRNKHGGD